MDYDKIKDIERMGPKVAVNVKNAIQTKIPYDYEDKRFMTLDDKADSPCLNINRYADPYIKGQLTIRLSRLTNVRRKKHTTINTIKSRHFDYYE